MSRRGAQLVLVAVLGLVLWTMTGADAARGTVGEVNGGPAAAPATALTGHLTGGTLDGSPVLLATARSDRAGAVARAQRFLAAVVLLMGGSLALRSVVVAGRRGPHVLPVWSGWFADPGRLRGPPAI